MARFRTLNKSLFYALSACLISMHGWPALVAVLVCAGAVGAWLVDVAVRYAGMLQGALCRGAGGPRCEAGVPTLHAGGPCAGGGSLPDGDPGTLLARAVFAACGPPSKDCALCRPPAPWRGAAAGAIAYGASMAVLYGCHGAGPLLAALCAAMGIVLILSIVDARTGLLPDALTLPLLWLGLVVALLGGPVSLDDAVAGAVSGYLSLWGLSQGFRLVRRCNGMGHGDFKFFAALGAWSGMQPLPHLLLAACLSGILFACVRQRTLRPSGAYPFGPFLAAAGAGVVLAQSAFPSYGW